MDQAKQNSLEETPWLLHFIPSNDVEGFNNQSQQSEDKTLNSSAMVSISIQSIFCLFEKVEVLLD